MTGIWHKGKYWLMHFFIWPKKNKIKYMNFDNNIWTTF